VAGFWANLWKEGGGKEWSSYPEHGGSRFDENNGEFLPLYWRHVPEHSGFCCVRN